MASDLRSADEIRTLVRRVQAAFSEEPGCRMTDLAREIDGASLWSSWALAVAERLDPLGRLHIDSSGKARLADPNWLDQRHRYDQPDEPADVGALSAVDAGGDVQERR